MLLRRWCVALAVSVAIVAGQGSAADRLTKTPPPEANVETIELFDGIEGGQLEVKYIPHDEKRAKVLVRNTSGESVNVRLPVAFAAVPVLAQFNFPAAGNNRAAQNNQSSQAVAGPMGNGLNFGNNIGGGNNQNGQNFFQVFNVPAEKLVELNVPSVCLEYGKPTPRPQARYELKRLSEVVSNPEAFEVVFWRLADRQCSQSVAQAAAWNLSALSDRMSWRALAGIEGELTTIGRRGYFSAQELQQAKTLVAQANETRKYATTGGKRSETP